MTATLLKHVAVKSRRGRKLQLSDRGDWDAQNFNFVPKYGGFSAPNFAFLNVNFPTRKNVSDNFPTAQFFFGGGGGNCSPHSLPARTLLVRSFVNVSYRYNKVNDSFTYIELSDAVLETINSCSEVPSCSTLTHSVQRDHPPSNSNWPYLSSDLVRSEREYC